MNKVLEFPLKVPDIPCSICLKEHENGMAVQIKHKGEFIYPFLCTDCIFYLPRKFFDAACSMVGEKN